MNLKTVILVISLLFFMELTVGYKSKIFWLIALSLVGKWFDILKTDRDTHPLDKLPSILKKNLDKNLCVCNELPKMDIINAIVKGAIMVGEVKKQTYIPRWEVADVFSRSSG